MPRKKVTKKITKRWNGKNISEFRSKYKKLSEEYGIDLKFKIATESLLIKLVLDSLIKNGNIRLIAHLVQPKKSVSYGFYLNSKNMHKEVIKWKQRKEVKNPQNEMTALESFLKKIFG